MDKEKLAEELFLSISVGIQFNFDKTLKEIANDTDLDESIKNSANAIHIQLVTNGYTNFRDTLNLIVELCSPADTVHKKYLLSKAYFWLGAEYRKLAIEATEDYLQYDDIYNGNDICPLFKNGQEVFNIDKKHHMTLMKLLDYSHLLEREYKFNEALSVLKKADYLFPYDYCIHANIFRVLRKMNQLDLIIEIIHNCLEQEWAKPCLQWNELRGNYWFNDRNQRCLLADLEKYTALKERNYVYKPRPRKKSVKEAKK